MELKPLGLIDRAALARLQSKKRLGAFSHYDVWLDQHAYAFSVAKMMDEDLLRDTQEALAAALADGTSFREFKARLKPILMAKGWWGEAVMIDPLDDEPKLVQLGSTRRLKTIFQTNIATAHAASRWQRVWAARRSMPFLRYNASHAKHKREAHQRYVGLILPVEHEIWQTIFPPNGYGCQCSVSPLTRKQAERAGGVSPEPDIDWVDVENPRTGEKVRVPRDITPSFAHNHTRRVENVLDLAAQRHGTAFANSLMQQTAEYIRERVERPNFIGEIAPNLSVIDDGGITNAQELVWGHAGRGYQLGETVVGQPFSYEHFQQGQTDYLLSYLPDGVELIKIPQKELQQLKQLEMQQLLSKLVNDNDRDYLQRHMEQLLAADFGQADLADKLAGYLYTTNGGYQAINPALIRLKRDLSSLDATKLQAIRAIDEFLAKSTKYIGTTTRKIKTALMPDAKAFIQAHQKGSIVRYSNFTSTSKPNGSFGGSASDVVLTIHGKSGVDISALSRFHHEGEVLMPRHTVYQVKTYEYKDGIHHIELEEVNVGADAEIRGKIIQLSLIP